jgi:acyl dehydratase
VRVFHGIDQLEAAVGEHLGHSDWHTITQEEVNLFAEATGDHQWIHTDVERAKGGPFGGTIAHGYLTLSLVPVLTWQIYRVDGLRMGLNYGANKLRFPAPVPVGSRIRAGAELLELNRTAQGATIVVRTTVEVEGSDKPGCVVENVTVLVP